RQAVKALNLDCRCYGVTHPQGGNCRNSHDGGFLDSITDQNETTDELIPELIFADFDQALANFEEGFIDLLHITGKNSSDFDCANYRAWLSRLSKPGIVLFHNTNAHDPESGIGLLWRELTREYRHFEFVHGGGLG